MVAQSLTSSERRQQAINRAMDKAHDQARAGNVPTLRATWFDGQAIHETWRVGSRTQVGRTYTVALRHGLSGIETVCECSAGEVGQICWHRAVSRLAHQDAIRSTNEAGLRFRQRVAS